MKRAAGGFLMMAVLLGVALVGNAPVAAAAASGLVWGPSFPDKSYTFHQPHTGSASPTLVSGNSMQKFLIQDDGNLVTYKAFNIGLPTDPQWYPYWASHTDHKGLSLNLQSDGNIVERGADQKVLWASDQHPGIGYNYYLLMQDDGNLVEYYSKGDPRKAPQSVSWSTGRLTNQHRICNSGPVDAGDPEGTESATEFGMIVQDGAGISVKVNNKNILGLPVTVSRWQNNRENGAQTYVIPPWGSHTFSNWYEEDNWPEIVTMHIRTPSNSVIAGYQATGNCWYLP